MIGDSPTKLMTFYSQDKPQNGQPKFGSTIMRHNSQYFDMGMSMTPTPEKKIFGFQIYVDNDILEELGDLGHVFSQLKEKSGVEQISFNSQLIIPDLNGRNVQIYSTSMDKKYECCRKLLTQVYEVYQKRKKDPFSIIIFVPEGMVSLLIGTKGHQINKIMKQSRTTIVINQPINRMTYRTAKISGQHPDIARACKIIYQILQQKSSIAYSIQKQPSQMDYTKSRVRCKLIFSESYARYIRRHRSDILRKVENQTNTFIRVDQDIDMRIVRSDERSWLISGKLEDVQAAMVFFINFAHDYLQVDRKTHDSILKMLIPGNYVTKLIGQKGSMIKDINDRSGAAQIKIQTDRDRYSDRDSKDCLISISGSHEARIDAACLILEQIECFKNGGPILHSGKLINQNLTQQFKNWTSKDEDITLQPVKNNNPFKMSQTILPSSLKEKQKDQRSQDQGLIIEPDYNLPKEQKPSERYTNRERSRRRVSSSRQSSRSGHKQSHRRSRSRSRNKKKRQTIRSSSPQYKHQREYVQVKMLVPRELGNDYRELKYIQNIGKSQIINIGEKDNNESVVIVKGTIKTNNQCFKLLQKRIARMKNSQASSQGR